MSNENSVITDEIRATLARDERIPHPGRGGRFGAARHGDAARQRRQASTSVERSVRIARAVTGGPLRRGRALGRPAGSLAATTRSAVRRCRR